MSELTFPVSPNMTDRTPAFADAAARDAAVRATNDALSQLSFFRELLVKHEPRRSDVFTHVGLLEHCLVELSRVTGYDGMTLQENERRHAELRAANNEIFELRRQVGQQVTATAISNGMAHYERVFATWWAAHGFRFADTSFTTTGIRATVGHELVNTTPRSSFADKRLLRIAAASTAMIDEPEFDVLPDQFHSELLDSDRNRGAIIAEYARSLPGARVTGFSSVLDGENFYLRHDVLVPYEALENYAARLNEAAAASNGGDET